MRGALAIIVAVFLLAILASTALIVHSTIEQTNRAVETELVAGIVSQTNASPELRKTLTLYRAFEHRRTAGIAHRAMGPVLVEIGILVLFFLFVLYGVSRPAKRLARSVAALDFSKPAAELVLREEGSQEVRGLIRSFNGMIVRLKDYEGLVGDAGRFRGWKEISRVIVHEVNNLISPVETYASYLAEKLDGRDADKASAILAKLGEIREILVKFRSMSHLPEPKLEPLDLSAVARDVTAEFGKPVPVTSKGDCTVNGDRVLLGEMIRNVVKNGLESGADAAVFAGIEQTPSGVVLTVADDGPGMSDETLARAFDSGYTTKEGGLGIGLSVVRAIALEHRAAVRVESQPGTGTTFEFRFPPAGQGAQA